MRWPESYAPRRTDMGDDLTAAGKFAHRKVLYGRQEGNCKSCSHCPKWSKGHGGIRSVEPQGPAREGGISIAS